MQLMLSELSVKAQTQPAIDSAELIAVAENRLDCFKSLKREVDAQMAQIQERV